MPEFDEPFFKRLSTHSIIGELAGLHDWTIYLGSGATIDRTGMSWRGLVKKLLDDFEKDESLQDAILNAYGEIRTATIVEGLYRAKYNGEMSQMNDDVRKLLYQNRKFIKGRLLESVAGFAYHLAKRGDSVVVVTTNYDSYAASEIFSHIQLALAARADTDSSVDYTIYIAADDDPRPPEVAIPRTITCAYVHGFVKDPSLERRTFSDLKDQPIVLSEGRYYATYARTRDVLGAAFRDRNVLIVGSAVSDPPLIDALRNTTPREESETVRRYAILPMQSGEFDEPGRSREKTRLPDWNAQRLEDVGVVPIYCDFFSQAGQLVHEVHKCMERGDADTMSNGYSPHRYWTRLINWWNRWEASNCSGGDSQTQHHHLLKVRLSAIKRLLRSPIDESLKLDMWVRWHPESQRRLTLWASSSGTWVDQNAMRTAEIPGNTEHVAVGAFCNGAPSFVEEPPDSGARWRTYLGVPIWLDLPQTGDIPVAVITLASMRDSASSSVSERNLLRLNPVLEVMRAAGAEIVRVDSD